MMKAGAVEPFRMNRAGMRKGWDSRMRVPPFGERRATYLRPRIILRIGLRTSHRITPATMLMRPIVRK